MQGWASPTYTTISTIIITGELAGTDVLDASMLIMLMSHLRPSDECTRDIQRGLRDRVAGHNNRNVCHANIVDRLDALHERVNALQLMLSDKLGFSYRSAMTSTWEGVAGTGSGQGVYQIRRISAKSWVVPVFVSDHVRSAWLRSLGTMAYLQDDPPLPAFHDVFPHLETRSSDLPHGLDPFTVTTHTGFLPVRLPVTQLPPVFEPLQQLLKQMPIKREDGLPGLLAKYQLGPTIDDGALPDLTSYVAELVQVHEVDFDIVTALFRDYSFLASAYLLEPCWENWSKDHNGGYGLGREVLPRCIAGPLMIAAQVLDLPPFMSYAASYALYNYYLKDPSKDASDYSNLHLVRAFEHGLDARSSEAGFILTHIHMVQETGALVGGAVSLLKEIEIDKPGSTGAKSAFLKMLQAMERIEAAMESMWSHSLPKEYISYRTFIFGITNQSMFPDGVVYEGENDDKPMYFRGESGANDSIIPLLDHILEVPMPKNPLTEILIDFRNYRPKPHRIFLSYMVSKAAELGVRQYCCQDTELAQLYLKLLDHVRSFRWRHWLFAREYIIKRSTHPTATGGSPIVTWLPNQLIAVMDLMETVYEESGLQAQCRNGNPELQTIESLMANVHDQRAKLDKEVRKYCEERQV